MMFFAPGLAYSADRSPPPFVSASDTASVSSAELDAEEARWKDQYCAVSQGSQAPQIGRDTALRNVRRMLSDKVGTAPLAAVDAELAAKGDAELAKASVIALLSGNPGGALATELARAAAGSAAGSRNAAALLPFFGLYAEALALADSRIAAAPTDPAAAGTDNRAVALNARGTALIGQRRWKDADVVLRQALKIDPDFTVAAANLAIAALCAGKTDARKKHLLGVWRRQTTVTKETVPGLPGTRFAPIPIDTLDFSAAHDGLLPDLWYPTDPERAAEALQWYQRLETEFNARTVQRNNRKGEIAPFLGQRYTSTIAQARALQIQFMVFDTARDSKVLKASQAMMAKEAEWVTQSMVGSFVGALGQKTMECGGHPGTDAAACVRSWCGPEIRARHHKWMAWQLGFDQTVRAYWKLQGRLATGAASNLSDDLWHEATQLDIDAQADGLYTGTLMATAVNWSELVAGVRQQCLDPPPPPEDRGEVPVPSGLADKCPSILANSKIGFKVGGILNFTSSCELVELELSPPLPFLAPFASVKLPLHGAVPTGSFIIYIGTKASLQLSDLFIVTGTPIPVPLPNFGYTAKSGLYVKFGFNGSVEDYGARIQPMDAAVSVSDFNGKTPFIEPMDTSFVGLVH